MTTLPYQEANDDEEKENQGESPLEQDIIIDEVEVPVKEKQPTSPLMKGEKSLFDEFNDGTENENLFT